MDSGQQVMGLLISIFFPTNMHPITTDCWLTLFYDNWCSCIKVIRKNISANRPPKWLHWIHVISQKNPQRKHMYIHGTYFTPVMSLLQQRHFCRHKASFVQSWPSVPQRWPWTMPTGCRASVLVIHNPRTHNEARVRLLYYSTRYCSAQDFRLVVCQKIELSTRNHFSICRTEEILH